MEQVVKASLGHYPQPFLISGKRTKAKISSPKDVKNYFFFHRDVILQTEFGTRGPLFCYYLYPFQFSLWLNK
jgi:hypothetical protein